MNKDKALRDELVFQLTKGHAHMSFAYAVKDFPEEKMNMKFSNGDYTFWHLLEHIRRTQNDILEFIENPNYKEREWPKDYWPEKDQEATKTDWDKTISLFHEDQKKLQTLVEDGNNDLYIKIPHGTGQTIIREIMVIVDHNAYHIGEFTIMRQVLKTWKQ
ncbi:MAG: DinB family protein [Candidatus Levyibacteriota bacterium]